MKVKILRGCTKCGACSAINSDIFEMTKDGVNIHNENVYGNEIDCIDAAIACPVNVIQIDE